MLLLSFVSIATVLHLHISATSIIYRTVTSLRLLIVTAAVRPVSLISSAHIMTVDMKATSVRITAVSYGRKVLEPAVLAMVSMTVHLAPSICSVYGIS